MKVGYKTSVRIAVWLLFLLYGLLVFEAGFAVSVLSGWAVFTAAFWSFLVNRFFTVDPDGLINNLSRSSYDLRDGGFVLLEGKKVFVVVNSEKRRVQIFPCLADRGDWEVFRSWVEEHKPAEQQEFPLHVGPAGKVLYPIMRFCKRYAKPILAVLAIGILSYAGWWAKGVWDRHTEIERLVDRAESALNREDWREARAAADELHALVPDDERAIDLLVRTGNQLRPRLAVRATRNGEEVAATVRFEGVGEGDTHVLPATLDFYGTNRSYTLFVGFEENGRWYQAPPLEIVTEWEGVREMDVPLEPYPGPAPVYGENWRSPATGMEFVWMEDLEIWVGKYEATNEEYRKMNPDHDSGAYEGHSLNGDRQPVVQVSFKDAVAFARWMTHREYETEKLPRGYRYRLPSDREFQTLMRVGGRQRRPWGNQWPPPKDLAVNYSGEESLLNEKIEGYRDAFIVSAPVDDLWINPWGLAGVGGNVWEVTTYRGKDLEFRYWRGEAWTTGEPDPPGFDKINITYGSKKSFPEQTGFDGGFRLVLSP